MRTGNLEQIKSLMAVQSAHSQDIIEDAITILMRTSSDVCVEGSRVVLKAVGGRLWVRLYQE